MILGGLAPYPMKPSSRIRPARPARAHVARGLGAAGVAVETWRVPGQIHGFLAMGGVIARAAPMLQRLGAALAASPAAG